jgi:hypothetical protein
MVHVTNGPHIAMRLVAFEFLLGHLTVLCSLSALRIFAEGVVK